MKNLRGHSTFMMSTPTCLVCSAAMTTKSPWWEMLKLQPDCVVLPSVGLSAYGLPLSVRASFTQRYGMPSMEETTRRINSRPTCQFFIFLKSGFQETTTTTTHTHTHTHAHTHGHTHAHTYKHIHKTTHKTKQNKTEDS